MYGFILVWPQECGVWTLLLTKADIMIDLGQDDWADDPTEPDGDL